MPHLTANGGTNPSAMHRGMTWKRRMRVYKAAQLTALGHLSDNEIASHIGITQPALSVLKTTKEFQSAMIALATGIVDQETAAICQNIETQREMIASMVPAALMQLQKFSLSARPEIALKASLEILDRDGKHSKVSRTSVSIENHIDLSATNVIGNNILNILRGAGIQPVADPLTGAVDAGPQIAEDILAQFTRNAIDATAQVNAMADVITEQTLEEIDSASDKIQ